MTANDSKFYFGYLNKSVNEYNNTYHRFIGKKPIHVFYLALTQEFESSHKARKCKVGDRVTINKCKNIFSKGHTQN